MWCGEPRVDGYVPAYCFYFVEASIVEAMKGVLTKAIFETNSMEMFGNQAKSSKSSEGSDAGIDQQWLEAQLVADRADVLMQDEEQKDYDDFDLDQLNDELDYLDRYEQESKLIKQEESKN